MKVILLLVIVNLVKYVCDKFELLIFFKFVLLILGMVFVVIYFEIKGICLLELILIFLLEL